MRFPQGPKAPGVCGISPGFPRLSPSRGQVIHVLLTRSPLYSSPEGPFRVRLACVRRAASVDSEPGSNSQVKVSRPQPATATPRPPPRRARSHRVCRSDFHPESDEVVLHVQPIYQRSAPPRIAPAGSAQAPPTGPRGGPASHPPSGARKTAAQQGANTPLSRRTPTNVTVPVPRCKPKSRFRQKIFRLQVDHADRAAHSEDNPRPPISLLGHPEIELNVDLTGALKRGLNVSVSFLSNEGHTHRFNLYLLGFTATHKGAIGYLAPRDSDPSHSAPLHTTICHNECTEWPEKPI